MTKNKAFFKEKIEKFGMEILRRIMKKMKYKFLKGGNVLFNVGDVGDKFFVIIEGKVGIWCTSFKFDNKKKSIKKKLEEEQKNMQD